MRGNGYQRLLFRVCATASSLLLSVILAEAQDSPGRMTLSLARPAQSADVGALIDSIRELQAQVQALNSQVSELRAEEQGAQAETRELQSELNRMKGHPHFSRPAGMAPTRIERIPESGPSLRRYQIHRGPRGPLKQRRSISASPD